MHCHTAWGQWAAQLLQCTASLLRDSGQWNSYNALHSLPRGSGQWNSYNALHSLPGGSGQWNPCNALPHCPGAEGSGTPAMHCHTARGQRAAELVQCAGPLAGGTGSHVQEAVAA